MRILLPNSAFLINIDAFLRAFVPDDSKRLDVEFHPKWIAVHPVVLAMTACAGANVRRLGGVVDGEVPQVSSLPYLVRMRLFEHLGLDPGLKVEEHEAAGRFIPLTQIGTNDQLGAFIVDMIPLLHVSPDEADPIKYVVSELVRNVLEHSGSPVGALVCAQYFADSQRLAIGVADAGMGIRKSMSRHHNLASDLDAITLAMRPGVTGTTSRLGGTEYNAGAGLFFIKAIALTSKQLFAAYSGSALFKLLTTRDEKPKVQPDAAMDRATRVPDLPNWVGTIMGIDIGLESRIPFRALLEQIRAAYSLDIKSVRRAKYRKPRFG